MLQVGIVLFNEKIYLAQDGHGLGLAQWGP
jgi:hypothetical protein